MIINIKYHIASLAAVFLALAIGILIGTTMLGNDTLTKTQETIINDLRKNYDKINDENKGFQNEIKKLQSNIENHQEFEKKTLPILVGNKLAGRQIAIIETNPTSYREDLVNLLKISGAAVTSDTVILKAFNQDDDAKRAKLANDLKLNTKDKDELSRQISLIIARYLLTGQHKEEIDVLSKEGYIKSTGAYGVPVSAVVVIGGSVDDKTNNADIIDTPIINYLNEQKIPVYGVESSDAAISYIKNYQKLKITTVDDFDLIPGQVALVWAIERNLPGDYGIKGTAKQLMPAAQ